jgi:uncharacterized protein
VLKKAIINMVGVVCVAALSSFSQAASFDCAKAAAPIEKLICSDEATSKLDADLAAVYKAAMQKTDKSDDLKLQQRAWLKEKRNLCKDAACMLQVYQARIAELIDLSTGAAAETNSEKVESANKKFITFTLVEGDGYPLCKEYVEMLNKTQYTAIPACGPIILPNFKNFKKIDWVEMTDKELVKKVLQERAAVKSALNPTHSKQMYSPDNEIRRINEKKSKMFLYETVLSDDGVKDIVYRVKGYPNYDRKKKYGHCESSEVFYFDDSTVTLQSIDKTIRDKYGAFGVSGSNFLFIYGSNLYVSMYGGEMFNRINIEVYGVDNKKMCGILAK